MEMIGTSHFDRVPAENVNHMQVHEGQEGVSGVNPTGHEPLVMLNYPLPHDLCSPGSSCWVIGGMGLKQ